MHDYCKSIQFYGFQHSGTFNQGFHARYAGKKLEDAPDTRWISEVMYQRWIEGWKEAQARIEQNYKESSKKKKCQSCQHWDNKDRILGERGHCKLPELIQIVNKVGLKKISKVPHDHSCSEYTQLDKEKTNVIMEKKNG